MIDFKTPGGSVQKAVVGLDSSRRLSNSALLGDDPPFGLISPDIRFRNERFVSGSGDIKGGIGPPVDYFRGRLPVNGAASASNSKQMPLCSQCSAPTSRENRKIPTGSKRGQLAQPLIQSVFHFHERGLKLRGFRHKFPHGGRARSQSVPDDSRGVGQPAIERAATGPGSRSARGNGLCNPTDR